MSKKTLVGVGIIILLIIIGALIFSKKQSAPVSTEVEMKSSGGTVQQEKEAAPEPKLDMITSIKDAMGLGKTMQCTYSMQDGTNTIQSTVLVDGQKFRATTTTNGEVMNVISDGKTQYLWSDKTRQGFKIDMTCLENLKKSLPESTQNIPNTTPEDISEDFDTARNVSCQPATINESNGFTIPTNVQFVDQCEMLQQSTRVLEQMRGTNFQVPSGTLPNTPPVQQ